MVGLHTRHVVCVGGGDVKNGAFILVMPVSIVSIARNKNFPHKIVNDGRLALQLNELFQNLKSFFRG